MIIPWTAFAISNAERQFPTRLVEKPKAGLIDGIRSTIGRGMNGKGMRQRHVCLSRLCSFAEHFSASFAFRERDALAPGRKPALRQIRRKIFRL